MPTPVSADISVDLNVSLTAVHQRASRADTSEGYDNSIEDIAISDIFLSVRDGWAKPFSASDTMQIPKWRNVSLLTGVDTADPNIQLLLQNLLELVLPQATEALFEDATL